MEAVTVLLALVKPRSCACFPSAQSGKGAAAMTNTNQVKKQPRDAMRRRTSAVIVEFPFETLFLKPNGLGLYGKTTR
jgi:hypothetical protein